MEKRKETISDLPRQGGQKKKMGKNYMYYNTSILNVHVLCDKLFLKLSHMYHVQYHKGTVEWLLLDCYISDDCVY